MPLPPPTFDARLVNTRELSASVREFAFARVDGAPLVFEAGQWVNLLLPVGDAGIKRSYSIASAPDGSPRFELAVTRVQGGAGSSYLHAMEPGATLRVVGPQGFFTRPLETATPSLFIGTGTGVTPLRSMLRAAIAQNHAVPMWLLFGVRHKEDILYRDELEGIAAAHPHIRVDITLSRPGEDWAGLHGYVQTHVRQLWSELDALGQGAPHAYVCGLHKMVGSVRELLRKDVGVPRQQVHTERYD